MRHRFSYLLIIADYKGLTDKVGITVETRDISLAARILAQFPNELGETVSSRSFK